MINRPSLPILHFEQSQLVIGAAARRSVEDTNFFVMQIAQHKVEQVGSCNQVPANSAIIEGQKLKSHAITRTANLKSDHAFWTKPFRQNFRVSGIKGEIGENETFAAIKAIDRGKRFGTRAPDESLGSSLNSFSRLKSGARIVRPRRWPSNGPAYNPHRAR